MVTLTNPCPGCTTGNGNSPPARKLASLPLTAIKFGSARICNRFFCCNARTIAPKLMSGRNRKMLSASVKLTVGLFEPVLVVLAEPDELVVEDPGPDSVKPPNCPAVVVPTNFEGPPVVKKLAPSCIVALRSTSANLTSSKTSCAPTAPEVSTLTTLLE